MGAPSIGHKEVASSASSLTPFCRFSAEPAVFALQRYELGQNELCKDSVPTKLTTGRKGGEKELWYLAVEGVRLLVGCGVVAGLGRGIGTWVIAGACGGAACQHTNTFCRRLCENPETNYFDQAG